MGRPRDPSVSIISFHFIRLFGAWNLEFGVCPGPRDNHCVTTRGTLLGIGAVLWLAALGCWIRARGDGRLSREGLLFLLLGAPFLFAGWFYTASSYPQDLATPAPAPAAVVVVTTPSPTPSPPKSYAEAVDAAQVAAVARYPDLGRAGTPFNARFVAAYRRLRFENPDYFSDPQWPLRLADDIARTTPHAP